MFKKLVISAAVVMVAMTAFIGVAAYAANDSILGNNGPASYAQEIWNVYTASRSTRLTGTGGPVAGNAKGGSFVTHENASGTEILNDKNGLQQVQPPVTSFWTISNVTFTANQAAPCAYSTTNGTTVKHVCTWYKAVLVSDGTGGADYGAFTISDGTTTYTDRGGIIAGANMLGVPIQSPPGFSFVCAANTTITVTGVKSSSTHAGWIVEAGGYDTTN